MGCRPNRFPYLCVFVFASLSLAVPPPLRCTMCRCTNQVPFFAVPVS
jgi:hypothetical protein